MIDFRISIYFNQFCTAGPGRTNLFLHQLPTPCLAAKRVFQKASLFDCPRCNAIALCGARRPRRHRGEAPGCRCQSRRGGQRWPWPRSWKSRLGFFTNLSEFFHLANSFSWRIFTNLQGMTPYDLAERGGHAMVLGWLKPVPWHCSWKSVQFHSFGEDFYRVVDTTTCASWRIRCG